MQVEAPLAHPFLADTHTARDMEVLKGMLDRVLLQLARGERRFEEDGFRAVVNNPEALRDRVEHPDRPLAFVGFFGLPRTGADRSGLEPLDQRLIEAIRKNPGLLGYSSVRLQPSRPWWKPWGSTADERWANLVLFSHEGAIDTWRKGTSHAQAVAQSPALYEAIRIHRGDLDLAQRCFVPRGTKKFDFAQDSG